jgi:hypothetical protein
MVNVKVETPVVTRMGLGANSLEMTGGAIAVRVALAEPVEVVLV